MSSHSANLVGLTGGPVSKVQAVAVQQVAHRHKSLATRVVQKELEQRKVNLPLWQRSLEESNRSADRAQEIYTEYRVAQVLKYIEAIESEKTTGTPSGPDPHGRHKDLDSLRAENATLLSAHFENNRTIAGMKESLQVLSSQVDTLTKNRKLEAERAATLGKVVSKVGRLTAATGRQLISMKKTVAAHGSQIDAVNSSIASHDRSIGAINAGLKNAQRAFRELRKALTIAPHQKGTSDRGSEKRPPERIDGHALVSELALFGTVLPVSIFLASIVVGAFLGTALMYAGLALLCAASIRSTVKTITILHGGDKRRLSPAMLWGAWASVSAHSLIALFLVLYLGAKLIA
ncbi:hypothetical protein [Alcanivorax sp. 1008]|uniref:hypothetical protein n=1 Tax=Alcanivorax sp. 1008 TaxID=2816853 RepID=UPI001D448EA2|nr:hypothetical protein [Alcanivorax sp. 1008]MCC1496789.1 hypothetical protein [Alcanivorax sp. 1008]